jgi:hypothetical protein
MSYGLTVKLLEEVLPIGQTVNAATVRNHAHAVAERIEEELVQTALAGTPTFSLKRNLPAFSR